MSNEFGYFEYSDVSTEAKESAVYSINVPLQEGSSLNQLNSGVSPYDYASFENGYYSTDNPKLLYRNQQGLGLATENTSNRFGEFFQPIILTANFPSNFSASGIKISSKNIIKEMEISVYDGENLIEKKTFESSSKVYFYKFVFENINKIVFEIKVIEEPLSFFGIFNIEYGSVKLFNAETLIGVEMNRHFSLSGEKLEYDTLDLSILDEGSKDYLFQKKQEINYIDPKNRTKTYFVDKGEDTEEVKTNLSAYDWVSLLEEEFMGGIYENYPTRTLYSELLPFNKVGILVSNEAMTSFTGYIPRTTKRKALQMVLQGTNIRGYKSGNEVYFDVYNPKLETLVLDESNIVKNPQITKKPKIGSVTVKQHIYTKGKEITEAYHWYISTTQKSKIFFSNPLHNLKAYEVIGVDENGQDIVSETESSKVIFEERSANYCVVSNSSTNKIVITGNNYIESVVEHTRKLENAKDNGEYENLVFDLQVWNDPQKVCDFLFELYNRNFSIVFQTTENLELGGYYKILGQELNITKIKDRFNGLYEVEAE